MEPQRGYLLLAWENLAAASRVIDGEMMASLFPK
jgi:hypothetical protein